MGEVDRLRARTRASGRRTPSNRMALPVVALVVGLITGVAGGIVLGRPGGPLAAAPPTESPERTIERLEEQLPPIVDAPVGGGAWEPLPAAPLTPRSSLAATWTGAELLVWGGAADDGTGGTTFLADGAALADDAWRPLPTAPLSARTGHAAVWTGEELLVWGGQGRSAFLADGAALNPVTGRWRALPPAPLSPRADAVAVWTGAELLVAGGRDAGGALTDAAVLDLDAGRWRQTAALPPELAGEDLRGLAAGGRAVVWQAGRGGGGAAVAAWDPAGGAWSLLPAPAPGDAGLPVLVAGDDGGLLGLRVSADGTEAVPVDLPPGAADWTAAEQRAPLDDPWNAAAAWTGDGMVVVPPFGPGARWDAAAGAWSRLPDGPALPGGEVTVTWTGDSALALAASPPGRSTLPPAAARYRP